MIRKLVVCIYCAIVFFLAGCEAQKNTMLSMTPTQTASPILEILQDLNQGDSDELAVLECPTLYPNYIASGQTSAWVRFDKLKLRAMGVYVRWNCKAKAYEFTTKDHLTPECGC